MADNRNTAIGNGALQNNTTGTDNTAVGSGALQENTTGWRNTAVGSNTLYSNTEGWGNVALGTHALYGNTDGWDNVAIGDYALYSNTTGFTNTAIGDGALKNNKDGKSNVAIGDYALSSNIGSSNNVACGSSALGYLESGRFNVGVGDFAGNLLSNNDFQTKAYKSIFIGDKCKGSVSDDQSNQIVIGSEARGYGSNTAHIGNSNMTTISYGAGTGSGFTNRSDPRIKEDIQDADLEMCYNDIKSLPLHRFKYKDFVGNTGDKHLTGFLSTEFAKVFPKAIHKSTASFDEVDKDGNKVYEVKLVDDTVIEPEKVVDSITGETTEIRKQVVKQVQKEVPKQIVIEDCEGTDTSQIVPTLMGAVQMLMKKVEELENRLSQET